MTVYFRLLQESFLFAINALTNNKLRTILSLLGVTIGIFSIIAALTAVDSLDQKIKGDLSGLDKNTLYLFRFPFGPSDIPLWKREQFPNVTYDEFQYIKRSLAGIDKIAYQLFTKSENIKYDLKTVSSVTLVPTTNEFIEIQSLELAQGRFFNETESNSGAPQIVLGHDIAKELFNNEYPLDKKVRLYGQRFTVIGIIKKQGSGSIGNNNDSSVFFPSNFIRKLYGDNNTIFTPVIVLKPKKEINLDGLKNELSQKLRYYRGIKMGEIDNFFINVFSGFTKMLDNLVSLLNLGGWIISGFSLLVGGFGIANIMFVSVKERTNLIGIQKSLGAKNKFILFQFLFEAIILSVLGGILGLSFVWFLVLIMSRILDFEFILSIHNIILGTSLAGLIGLISGILPATVASRLDPVEAIRTGY